MDKQVDKIEANCIHVINAQIQENFSTIEQKMTEHYSMQTATNTIANTDLLKNITNVFIENAEKSDANLEKLNSLNLEKMEENNKAHDRQLEANTKQLVKHFNQKSKATSLIIRPSMTTRNRSNAKKVDTDSLSSMDEEDLDFVDVSLSSVDKENEAETTPQNVN
jgi:hypothetical protein